MVRVESLDQPCRALNALAGRIVVDRKSGREQLVLANTNESSGLELIFIDLENDSGRVYKAPAGSGSWALIEAPGDRLIVGTYYDGMFLVFDLQKMEFVKEVAFPGEQYIWNFAIGSDGRVYGGTYPGAKLGALDLESYEVEGCGAPAPPNQYLRTVTTLPDGRLLCYFMMEDLRAMIYDPASGSFSQAPEHIKDATGVSWHGFYLSGSTVYDGKTLEPVNAPFPTPDFVNGEWAVEPSLTRDERVYFKQKNAIYGYAEGDNALALVADIDLRGGGLFGSTKDGRIVGVRGQDYFVIAPGSVQPELKAIPVASAPRPILFLRVDDKGSIWGGPHFGQTVFRMDPDADNIVNTGTVCDSGGEVYDLAFSGGIAYGVAYSGGDIVRYDPEEPWDQFNNANPKTFAHLSARGYIRPCAGAMFGPDGKLYSGWMAQYGKYGGALAITDPETGETELVENPLGEQALIGLAVDEKYAYIGTCVHANGLADKTGESPQLGIMDLATREIVFRQELDGGASVCRFYLDKESNRLAFTVSDTAYVFDAVRNEVVIGPEANLPSVNSRACEGANGTYYYGSGKSLIALDMKTGKADAITEFNKDAFVVAAAKDGTIYVACDTEVYKVAVSSR